MYRSQKQSNANKRARHYKEGLNSKQDWDKVKKAIPKDLDKFQLTIKRFETTLTCRTCKQFLTFVGEEFIRIEHEKEIQVFKSKHDHK